MPRTFTEKNNESEIITPHNIDIIYARIYLLDFSDAEILRFLNVSEPQLHEIKNRIHALFGTNNWFKLFEVLTARGLIKYEDYVNCNLKSKTVQFIDSFFQAIEADKDLNLRDEKISDLLRNFHFSNEITAFHKYYDCLDKDVLSDSELELIQLHYDYVLGEISTKELERAFPFQAFKIMEYSIFGKVGANNWFGTLRKALQYKLIADKKSGGNLIQLHINEAKAKLFEFLSDKQAVNSDIKLSIYHEILEMVIKLEFLKFGVYDKQ
ncbi:hypothetical protein [Seonamhaeicola sp. ML3]|uniref:hypothetical protein n=1 Tax=Seonamhaeicola sp. ML3 TaxID=2937786 RepID=UPI00200C35F7|nr:hypothetical protein [Seonamhaeicola sp. ML3]